MRVMKLKAAAMYTSKVIQSELITISGDIIQQKLLQKIRFFYCHC